MIDKLYLVNTLLIFNYVFTTIVNKIKYFVTIVKIIMRFVTDFIKYNLQKR